MANLINNLFNKAKNYVDERKKALQSVNTTLSDNNNIINEFKSQYPDASSYSYGGGGMTNLSNIFNSLEQGAKSQEDIAKQTYDTRREDLLTSLKRFQEQNARDVQNQQRAYLSNQASLESAIAQADRQNRISAAAKGLSGSGLQQLAQIQNLLSQGQVISNMATENQNAMDTLRRALAQEEENTKTAQDRALADYNNTLNKIASDLALNKANYEYQAQEAANNRAASAANARASIQAQYDLQAREDAKAFNAQLSNIRNNYGNALSKAKSQKDINKLKENYKADLANLLMNNNIGSDSDIYKNVYKQGSDMAQLFSNVNSNFTLDNYLNRYGWEGIKQLEKDRNASIADLMNFYGIY